MRIEEFLEALEIERNERRKKELDEMLFEERFFFSVEKISEDKPLRVGEKVIVLATGKELGEYIIPERYSLEIGKVEKVDSKSGGSKVRFIDGVCWWIPNKFLRRVVANVKTK